MAKKLLVRVFEAFVVAALLLVPGVLSDDNDPIPADASQIEGWFGRNVAPVEQRKDLDPSLASAETNAKVIKVAADGSGEFKTLAEAIKSIPASNTNRIIVSIGPGTYTERLTVGRTQNYVTFLGDAKDMPTLSFGGTAAQFGTLDSGTLQVEGSYFQMVNVKVVNTAPRPDMKTKGAQATAFEIAGDRAAFYNCKFIGFQDTLCDDQGHHFFKDCYVEGTVDFIFGNGKSLYLNCELHVISGDPQAVITAQSRDAEGVDTGYSFVHCKVTGSGGTTVLGRGWRPYAKVIFAYSDLSAAVNPEGWSDNLKPEQDKTLFYGELENKGPGADLAKRTTFTKKLTVEEAKPFISLAHIVGSKWLLPPPKSVPQIAAVAKLKFPKIWKRKTRWGAKGFLSPPPAGSF